MAVRQNWAVEYRARPPWSTATRRCHARIIQTGLHATVTLREDNWTAALELMAGVPAADHVSSETTGRPGLLEYPAEAPDYFRRHGAPQVICEAKHIGSRAVVMLCRDEDVSRRRFGVVGEGIGIVYTRTGRRFFDEPGPTLQDADASSRRHAVRSAAKACRFRSRPFRSGRSRWRPSARACRLRSQPFARVL